SIRSMRHPECNFQYFVCHGRTDVRHRDCSPEVAENKSGSEGVNSGACSRSRPQGARSLARSLQKDAYRLLWRSAPEDLRGTRQVLVSRVSRAREAANRDESLSLDFI